MKLPAPTAPTRPWAWSALGSPRPPSTPPTPHWNCSLTCVPKSTCELRAGGAHGPSHQHRPDTDTRQGASGRQLCVDGVKLHKRARSGTSYLPASSARISCFWASPQPDPSRRAQGPRPHRRAARDRGGIKSTETPAILVWLHLWTQHTFLLPFTCLSVSERSLEMETDFRTKGTEDTPVGERRMLESLQPERR